MIGCTFVYAVLSAGGKSRAREIETAMIQRMVREGFPMLSTSDGEHRNFGGGG